MAKAIKKTIKKKAVKKKAGKKVMKKAAAPEFTAKMAIEITTTFKDSIGLTAKISAALAKAKVNILAGTGYAAGCMSRKATFNFIVEDFAKAERVLDDVGADEINEQSILLVQTPNKPGALGRITGLISKADINIYYFYATTSSGRTATSVIKTANDSKALKIFTKAR